MTSRVDVFEQLPETVTHKVGFALAGYKTKLPFRIFEVMVCSGCKHPYFSTMELVRAAESPNLPYIVKTYLNPLLCLEGYQMINVIPEKAILDDYGYKSRQRYWGFVPL